MQFPLRTISKLELPPGMNPNTKIGSGPDKDMPDEAYPLGPYPHRNKSKGAHRDFVIPKLQGRLEVYAKKIREYYINESVIAEHKAILEATRLR